MRRINKLAELLAASAVECFIDSNEAEPLIRQIEEENPELLRIGKPLFVALVEGTPVRRRRRPKASSKIYHRNNEIIWQILCLSEGGMQIKGEPDSACRIVGELHHLSADAVYKIWKGATPEEKASIERMKIIASMAVPNSLKDEKGN